MKTKECKENSDFLFISLNITFHNYNYNLSCMNGMSACVCSHALDLIAEI